MFRDNHTILMEAIFSLRQSLAKHLPIQNSLVAYDLILLLAIHNYARGHITVKQLFSSLPYSATAVRYHYSRFINDGWIENYKDSKDKRIKYVRPTLKLIEAVNSHTEDTEILLRIKAHEITRNI
jgi:DNA-binding MarR family transcriptional regulator